MKIYPACYALQRPIHCLSALTQDVGLQSSDITKITIRTPAATVVPLIHHRPATGLQGKFSMEFCLASILVLRKAGLAEFTDETAKRADIRDAVAKIDYTVYSDEEAAANAYKPLTSFLDIELVDGRKISARADIAKGNPLHPMSEDEVGRASCRERVCLLV